VTEKPKVTVVAVEESPRLRLRLVSKTSIQAAEAVIQCHQEEIQAQRTWRTVQVDQGRHLKNEFLAYVDHSCAPNTLFDTDSLALVAIRPIQQGQPVTFFYPGSEVELAQEFGCSCGSTDCLRHISGSFYLTKPQMRWALEQGYCTPFISQHLRRLLSMTDEPTQEP
jgi:hypothetical protein